MIVFILLGVACTAALGNNWKGILGQVLLPPLFNYRETVEKVYLFWLWPRSSNSTMSFRVARLAYFVTQGLFFSTPFLFVTSPSLLCNLRSSLKSIVLLAPLLFLTSPSLLLYKVCFPRKSIIDRIPLPSILRCDTSLSPSLALLMHDGSAIFDTPSQSSTHRGGNTNK